MASTVEGRPIHHLLLPHPPEASCDCAVYVYTGRPFVLSSYLLFAPCRQRMMMIPLSSVSSFVPLLEGKRACPLFYPACMVVLKMIIFISSRIFIVMTTISPFHERLKQGNAPSLMLFFVGKIMRVQYRHAHAAVPFR